MDVHSCVNELTHLRMLGKSNRLRTLLRCTPLPASNARCSKDTSIEMRVVEKCAERKRANNNCLGWYFSKERLEQKKKQCASHI